MKRLLTKAFRLLFFFLEFVFVALILAPATIALLTEFFYRRLKKRFV